MNASFERRAALRSSALQGHVVCELRLTDMPVGEEFWITRTLRKKRSDTCMECSDATVPGRSRCSRHLAVHAMRERARRASRRRA